MRTYQISAHIKMFASNQNICAHLEISAHTQNICLHLKYSLTSKISAPHLKYLRICKIYALHSKCSRLIIYDRNKAAIEIFAPHEKCMRPENRLPYCPAYMGGVSAVLYRLLYRQDLPKYSRPVQIFATAYIFTFFLGKIKNLTWLTSVLSLQFKFVHNHKSCPNSAATLLSP